MSRKIGQLLLNKGLISPGDLAEARRIQREGNPALGLAPGEKLGRIITRCGFAPPMDVVRALCEQRFIDDYMLVGRYIISPALIARVPLEVAKRYEVLPIVSLDGPGEALFATVKIPSAEETVELESLLGLSIEWLVVKDRHFARTVDRVYALMVERGVSSVRIGEVLVREGIVTLQEVEWALRIAQRSNKRIGRVLMDEGLIGEQEFFRVLARHEGVDLCSATDILADKESPGVASRLSRKFAIFNEVIPYKVHGATLHVAASTTDVDLGELRKIYSCRKIVAHLVTPSDMAALLKAFYNLSDEEAATKGLSQGEETANLEVLSDVPVAEFDTNLSGEDLRDLRRRYESLVSNLLREAIRRRASDIHVETYENSVAVRLRIDGLLYDARTLRIDKSNVAGVVNVIKVLSNINIAERRLPQGGRFRKRTTDGHFYDFRVQCQPTLFGENVVIRVLNQSASITALKELGFSRPQLDRFLQVIVNPSGLVLITGPTGSGKTTTLYSILDLLRRDTTRKIVTIEDPIEYSLPRIQQSQVQESIDFTFAAATRAFLREDPDIALIGEIRDEETARETIKLSQTGHLVFSTLHTNTAAGAAPRMLVLGVDPELLASELLVVVAQRLARRICPECKTPYHPKPDLVNVFYPLGVPENTVFYKGAGCPNCEGLGHVGRVVIGEFWFIDRKSRLLVSGGSDEYTILKETIGHSYMPLLADALDKVQEGTVDISQLPLVLPMASVSSIAPLIQKNGLLTPAAT